jgi:hypothetical protein
MSKFSMNIYLIGIYVKREFSVRLIETPLQNCDF